MKSVVREAESKRWEGLVLF